MGSTSGSLSGVKVIDLSRVLGGPYCTQALADHGAEVIKIEPPMGDETRYWGPPFKGDASSYFIGVNRNKKGMALDLRKPEARDVLLKLLEDADVLIENFKSGTMEKWGIGYEECLQKKFPRLVYMKFSGFGDDGPFGGYPGYDAIAQAMAGVMSVNGSQETGAMKVGVPIIDMATGMNSVIGILLALNERHTSGKGQYVETTLYDTAISLLHPHSANWIMSGNAPKVYGNAHPNIVPYDRFETATGPIFLGAANDRQFVNLCKALGSPELAEDERFGSNSHRIENRDALTALLREKLLPRDGRELCAELLQKGITAGPIESIPDALTHPHTLHREMVLEQGDYKAVGAPVKLSRTGASLRSLPPSFGEHNEEVLSAAGYSDEEIAEMKKQGIILNKLPKQPGG